ncbi:Uncharacterised protein [uncultured archaeon]|nr:Uncharacterised protein [uncultured archaeon]
MKKLLSLYIVGILVLSGVGAVVITNGKTNDMKIKIESIAISKPVIKDEGQYVTVSFEEATASLSDSGKPMLPILTKVFTFPFNTQISSVDVSFSDTKELSLSKEVKPTEGQIPLDMTMGNDLIKNLTTYESAELYPATGYSYTVGAGLDGKEHVIYLAVQFHPIR